MSIFRIMDWSLGSPDTGVRCAEQLAEKTDSMFFVGGVQTIPIMRWGLPYDAFFELCTQKDIIPWVNLAGEVGSPVNNESRVWGAPEFVTDDVSSSLMSKRTELWAPYIQANSYALLTQPQDSMGAFFGKATLSVDGVLNFTGESFLGSATFDDLTAGQSRNVSVQFSCVDTAGNLLSPCFFVYTVTRNAGNNKLEARMENRETPRLNWPIIKNSPEWEKMINKILDKLDASNYPVTKEIYMQVFNEPWNFAGGFAFTSSYCIGIDRAFSGGQAEIPKRGSGILTAIYQTKFDAIMRSRGKIYNLIWINDGNRNNPSNLTQGFDGQTEWLNANGFIAQEWIAGGKTVGSVTNYFGEFSKTIFGAWAWGFDINTPDATYVSKFETEIGLDPQATAALVESFLKTAPLTFKNSIANIVDTWNNSETKCAAFNTFLGPAYEGGDGGIFINTGLDNSTIFKDWYKDVLRSHAGYIDAFRQLYTQLITEHPMSGIAQYSNFGPRGDGNSPWFLGPLGDRLTLHEAMNAEFQRS